MSGPEAPATDALAPSPGARGRLGRARPVGLLGLIEAAGRLLARNALVSFLTYALVYGSHPLILVALERMDTHWAWEQAFDVLSWLAFVLADAAVLVGFRDSALGDRPTVRGVYADAARRFVPYALTLLLVGLGIGMGLVLFVIPGVYVAVSWTLALPVVIIEGSWGGEAIRRSRALVLGHWWRTAVVLLLASIKAAVVFPVLQEASNLLPEITPLLEWILGALLYLFGSALQVVLYFDLRLRQSEAALSSAAASSTARTILS